MIVKWPDNGVLIDTDLEYPINPMIIVTEQSPLPGKIILTPLMIYTPGDKKHFVYTPYTTASIIVTQKKYSASESYCSCSLCGNLVDLDDNYCSVCGARLLKHLDESVQ